MTNSYESPFCTRYASKEMQFIFSADKKFTTWRKLWVALARAEMKLGLNVTQEQVDELEANIDNIDYAAAAEREKLVRHDVMSHVYAYGLVCPKAAGIIHLGATSCYVGDNTDVIIMRDALKVVKRKLVKVIDQLAKFADKYKAMPCLAYTHLQPAQLTTVGKRATLWCNELLMDLEDLDFRLANLKLLGSKGTTGTQASFMELFHGDTDKVKELEKTAFMWVKGSTRSEAVKCWFECVRASKTDPKYEQTNKDKFMENNPNWTDEMYDVKMDVVSDDYLMLFDYAYGISSALGDRKQFDGNQCLVDALYSDASNVNEEGVQSTWTQVREKYSATVDSEIKELNQKIASLKS